MKRSRRNQLQTAIEICEERALLSAIAVSVTPPPSENLQEFAAVDVDSSLQSAAPPAYHSNPSASVKVYLDFDGNFEAQWGGYSNVTTPVFSTDADPNFSANELNIIQEVWKRVAEDYAPFNVDVTTELPTETGHGEMIRVAIGGSSSDWLGHAAGGVAYMGSFTTTVSTNTVFAFTQELYNNARYIGDVASHESGHAFGLDHQSQYDSNGNFVAAYHPGSGNWAPIMGYPYNGSITTWHNGTTSSATTLQDDMSILSNSTNGFGYKVDDYGNVIQQASILPQNGTTAQIAGLISTNSDADVFAFSTNGGNFTFQLNTATVGANFDSVMEVRDGNNNLLASSNSTSTLNSTIAVTLGEGTYYVVVKSNGVYGRVGTYSLAGTGQFNQLVPQNTAPLVNAGTDSTTNVGSAIALNGQVTDDNLPNNQITTTWTQVSGPGTATFANEASINTTASFSATGTYVLRLSATDGEFTSFDELVVTVLANNLAPTVNAGLDRTITGKTTTLQGSVSDDGLPNGVLTYTWTKISGKGKVTLSNSNTLNASVTFGNGTAGSYVFRLTVSDGQYTVYDEVRITLPGTSKSMPWEDKVKNKDIDSLFSDFPSFFETLADLA